MKRLSFLLCAILTLAACATPAPTPAAAPQIVSTTSFGMCVGYCTTRLEISGGQAVLTRSGRSGRGGAELPDQRFTATLTAAERQDIERLASASALEGLPETIGCPDCADGGAESLSIAQRTITFDYGATVPQAQPLLERVRAIRTRMTPAS